MSEDCLSLDVFIPPNRASPGSPLPIIFWIYGGSLVFGSTSAYGDLAILAERTNSIVVAPNYRLGLLGFAALPAFAVDDPRGNATGSGNYGLTDQIVALQWTHTHARALGGDASTVTVIGQSSGGTSILGMLRAPTALPFFTRAVSLSASPNITMRPAAKHAADAKLFLANTPCAVASESAAPDATALRAVASCLRRLSPQAVIAATDPAYNTAPILAESFPSGPPPAALPWAPMLYVDGVTIPTAAPARGALVGKTVVLQTVQAEDMFGNVSVTMMDQWTRGDAVEWMTARLAPAYGAAAGRAAALLYDSAVAAAPRTPADLGNPLVLTYTIASAANVHCGHPLIADEIAASGARTYFVYYAAATEHRMAYTPERDDFSKCVPTSRAPIHCSDWLAATLQYDGWDIFCPYNATASDIRVGDAIANQWRTIAATGEFTAWSEWGSGRRVPVMLTSDAPDGEPFEGLTLVCDALRGLGIGQEWWWVN